VTLLTWCRLHASYFILGLAQYVDKSNHTAAAAIIAFIPAYVALLGGFLLFGAGYAVFRVIPYDRESDSDTY